MREIRMVFADNEPMVSENPSAYAIQAPLHALSEGCAMMMGTALDMMHPKHITYLLIYKSNVHKDMDRSIKKMNPRLNVYRFMGACMHEEKLRVTHKNSI